MSSVGDQDYTVSISVDKTPEEAFAAINNVRAWWDGQILGTTDKIGGVFTYQYGDLHQSTQKVIELVPGKRIAWLITKGGPNFVSIKNEWKDTLVVFEISRKGNKTEVRFTHKGLIPRFECYDSCSDAWGSIIRRDLRDLITKGEPGGGATSSVITPSVSRSNALSKEDHTLWQTERQEMSRKGESALLGAGGKSYLDLIRFLTSTR